ncbi:unnamed protein product [Pieris brassicae]|uniref:Uncharacterized protein n=1 Tax=Pieris brassicae TaxID=7116 RepID=A0A9P0X7R9_PIEBR|nr:unnamed protein product [Pieris brassicae]
MNEVLCPVNERCLAQRVDNSPAYLRFNDYLIMTISRVIVLLLILMCTKSIHALDRLENFAINNNGLGQYSFEFQTSDGTHRNEVGGLYPRNGGFNYAVRGEYDFIDPQGFHHSLKYIADENGEDVELRRIFPNEFPQDTVRKSGASDPEHLGRYSELKNYFRNPKSNINSHFEELACFNENGKKVCKIDQERYSPDEDQYYSSMLRESHVDRRRVYCIMLLCFTEDELDRIVASFDVIS